MPLREIGAEEARQIGQTFGDFMLAAGHPLTCNGGNPDWSTHHDHEVRMMIEEPPLAAPHLVCPECGRTQALPE